MSHGVSDLYELIYADGRDPVDVAEWLIAAGIESAIDVDRARSADPLAYWILPPDAGPSYWSRVLLAQLLNAGWRPPFGSLVCEALQ